MKVATVAEKRPVWKVRGRGLVRIRESCGAETYKNEDSVSASLPILHIFFVFKLLYTGEIHREDGSRRVSFLRSGGIIARVSDVACCGESMVGAGASGRARAENGQALCAACLMHADNINAPTASNPGFLTVISMSQSWSQSSYNFRIDVILKAHGRREMSRRRGTTLSASWTQ